MDAPPVQYVTTSDGFSIAYCVSGEGTPFVLMPFTLHIQLQWRIPVFRSLLEPLAGRFRLIQYDARGQGLSSRGLPEAHRLEDYERDLAAVVDRLSLERFVLYSGLPQAATAISYAVRHPERLEALVLFNPITQLHDFGVLTEGLTVQNWDAFVETLARTTPPFLLDPNSSAALVKASWSQADFLTFLHGVQRSSFSFEREAPGVRTPTLIFVNRGVPWLREEWGMRLASLIPDARLVVFDNPHTGLYWLEPGEPPGLAVLDEFLAGLPPRKEAPAALPARLSAREVEVLRLIAAGRSNPQIADELVISLNTVQRHVSNILGKTGLANRTEAAIYARDRGLL